MDYARELLSYNQLIELPELQRAQVELSIKREDKIHPYISGNKWRKCKYNLIAAQGQEADTILTYGGAYSNHIAAVAAATRDAGMSSVGIIRGEELNGDNPTLEFASQQGMQFHFVSRSDYRDHKEALAVRYGVDKRTYIIPEGGANQEGVRGCEEILSSDDKAGFDMVACCAGTGGTAAGILRSLGSSQQLRVYPALKGSFMRDEIAKWLPKARLENMHICEDYHFGGYAKTSADLLNFIEYFYQKTTVPLDPIYTAKMLFGLLADVRKGCFAVGTRILAIHTGGLQGVAGIEAREGRQLFDKPYPWSEN